MNNYFPNSKRMGLVYSALVNYFRGPKSTQKQERRGSQNLRDTYIDAGYCLRSFLNIPTVHGLLL